VPLGRAYGRMVEHARAEIEAHTKHGPISTAIRRLVFEKLLPSRTALGVAGTLLYLYEASGLRWLTRALAATGMLGPSRRPRATGAHGGAALLFSPAGQTFPAEGQQRYRVAFLAGCVANVSFARLNEATVRVLQKNGCEVVNLARTALLRRAAPALGLT